MSIIRLQGEQEKQDGIYYEVDSQTEALGSGGMGIVYPAARVDAQGVRRPAAVKFLFDDLPSTVILRAKQEASIQIKNDNLVEMFGFIQISNVLENGQIVNRYHVASELLHGVMLFDLLRGVTTDKNGQPIAFAQELRDKMQNQRQAFALFIVRNVLSGVMALHDMGYVHRDIDPSNIMITDDGKVKLIDFGIVKSLREQGPQLSQTGQFLGKPGYAAPEIVKGYVADHNVTTDIYSIGIMLFELVTGHLPFTGETEEVIEKQKTQMVPLEEIKNKEVAAVIRKATAKKQSERFQSAAEFRVAIEHILSGKTSHTEVIETKKPMDFDWKLIAIASGIGVLLGLIFGLVL